LRRGGWVGERASDLKLLSNGMQGVDGICALQFEELASIAGFHPGDAVIGNEEPHHVRLAEVSHKRHPGLALPIATDIAASHPSPILKAPRQGLEAEHQIINDGAVLLSQSGKHVQPGKDGAILKVFFSF
jgi:hypothetical protein